MTTNVREILVKVDAKGIPGLKGVANEFGRMSKNISKSTSVMQKFERLYTRVAGIGFAGLGLGAITSSLDEFQKLNDRLNQIEGSSEKATETLGKLVGVASITKSSVADISVVYARLAQSMSDLNIGTDAVLGVTVALQNSFRLYGATASEARGATIQLSQALASGQLRGQELRSVLEANGLMGEILAKQLGTTRGELLKFAEKNGGIKASDFLQALSDNFERINTMAEKLTPTIGESLTIAFDKVKLKMHELNKETGFSKKLSEVIFSVAENVDKIALAVGAAAGAWVAWKAALIVVNGLLFANNALLTVHAIASGSAMVNVALITGLLWKKAAALAAVQLALGPVAILIGALSASFIVLAGHNSEALKSLERMQKVGKEKGLVSYRDDVGLASDAVARLNDNTGAFVLRTPEAVDAIAEQSGFFGKASVGVGVYAKALKDGVLKIKDKDKATFNYTKSLAKLNEQYLKDKNVEKYNQALRKLEIAKLNFEFKEGKITLEKYNKGLEEIRLGKHISALKQFKGELGELNQKFASEVRAGNVVGYARALDSIRLTKMKNEAKEGKISLLEMNSQLRDASLTEFNRRLAEGSTTLSQYNAGTQAINFAKINEEWKAGTLNAADYNKAIVETTEKFNPDSAFFVGTNDYIKQAGTVSQNVATAITNTFGNLEQTFLDFTKTGKLNFKSFANAVLEDLQRILVRSMLIRPLAQGLMGALSPTDRAGGTTGYSSDYLSGNTGGYAKGGAFKGGVEFFAKGGVVSSPTAFGMRNGMGIMGEKGPEAILPLRRDGSGDLGVKATTSPVIVNIHNENGGEVEQTERQGPNGERILDILITKKIKETFANGSMDKQMSSSYGLRRRGV